MINNNIYIIRAVEGGSTQTEIYFFNVEPTGLPTKDETVKKT